MTELNDGKMFISRGTIPLRRGERESERN